MPGPVIKAPPVNTKVKGSPNKVIIGSLVATLQREVKKEKLFDALRKMNEDLNKVYEALFDGPLPAVDGYFLTRINAAVLNGPIPEEYNLAYTDRNNVFDRGQTIVWNDNEEPHLKLGFGYIGDNPAYPISTPSTYFRLGSVVDDEFFISQNMFYNGLGWDRENGALGASRLDFIDGQIKVNYYDAVLADFRETFRFEAREIVCRNFDLDDNVSIVRVDDDDVVRFGDSAMSDGTPYGWPAIPHAAVTSFPLSGQPEANGIIGIITSTTPPRFVFYCNGLRFAISGTAF